MVKWIVGVVCLGFGSSVAVSTFAQDAASVSYQSQVEPIFQAKCWSCHQPAANHGEYLMTDRAHLLAGGSSEETAIVPGKPDESNLVTMISPDKDGVVLMPDEGDPLSAAEVDLVKRWIEQGAVDDSTLVADPIDADHPPVYHNKPVITAVDFSPDGSLLAVNGFHEVVLLSTADWTTVGRLVGLSQRIESVEFSPDGKKLLVTGGKPGKFGEIQIWNVADQKLERSIPMTHDTIYGSAWSADSSKIAFGCADNTVRVIEAATGKQILYQGAHGDWVLDVVFSVDASNLISVGRDMTTKLTEVATNRFVDNVTSITPGILKGGLAAVARHPTRDEIVIGGSDGVPRVYRMFRLTKRVIGDDANLIRQLPELVGRIHAVDVSADGKRILAASSLDHHGEVRVYGYDFDTSLPDNLKEIMQKVVTSRSAEENALIEKYRTENVSVTSTYESDDGGFYAACFDPSGNQVVAAGDLGDLFLIDANSGQVVRQWSPFSVEAASQTAANWPVPSDDVDQATATDSVTVPVDKVAEISVEPTTVLLSGPVSECQLVVTAKDAAGDEFDVTRMAECTLKNGAALINKLGTLKPLSDGVEELTVRVGDQTATIPIQVQNIATPPPPTFIQDVTPILSRVGCNAGTCHGAAKGKNGFKLSLRGYDPVLDVRSFTDDLRCRRINRASPSDSLMLAKASGVVAHGGGIVLPRGSGEFELVRQWIASGARLEVDAPRVKSIEVFPKKRIIQTIGSRQQLRVVANYSDGSQRDVTRLAFCDSGNTEVLSIDRNAIATAKMRGDAAVLVRFEGNYAAATIAVMGDRTGFVWSDPPVNNRIDELTAAKWQQMKIAPSELCTDAEFVRRINLDLTGLPPSAQAVRDFVADPTASGEKRNRLIEKLIGSPEFVDYWTNKWSDLLMVNRKYLGPESAAAVHNWIRDQVDKNVPYDQFVRSILTASGSNHENPATEFVKILRTPQAIMESTTHLFLGVRFNCNKCHDHPFERWTQDQYYQTAAFFAQVSFKDDPASNGMRVGGTSVEPSRAVYEFVSDGTEGEVIHDRTGAVTPPKFPYHVDVDIPDDAPRRQQLATWLVSPHNPYFARSYANRIWSYLLGQGLIEPVDDIRAGNPPSNPELLDYLTDEFIGSGFDVRHLMRLICQSRTYQLSVTANRWNEDDKRHFSHEIPRRLPGRSRVRRHSLCTGRSGGFPRGPAGNAPPCNCRILACRLRTDFWRRWDGLHARASANATAKATCRWGPCWLWPPVPSFQRLCPAIPIR